MLVAKRLNFGGKQVEIFGEVAREATAEDLDRCLVEASGRHYLVDFTYGGVEYRGLWREDELLIVG